MATQTAPLAGLRILGRADILGAADLAEETVPTPEWEEGSAVRIRALDVARRQAYAEFGTTVTRDGSTIRFEAVPFALRDAALVALAVVDEQGEPQFTIADVEALGAKNPEPIARIAEVVRRLSKMTVADAEEVKAATDPTNGASPSASPVTSE